MVDQLNGFASEVSRVAREVGSEGKLGGQAIVPGVDGTWKDLTDNVNSMASNLTGQVRNIADVATAVANGDLSRKITVDVKGEILELKQHHQHDGGPPQRLRIRSFARGARGRLRRQARRPGGGARRGRHVEGPHRQRQLDGQQPHRPSPQHRRRDHGRRPRRPLAQDHGRREGRNSGAEKHRQHDGGSAQRLRLGSVARGPRSRLPKASSAARPRCPAWPARGRISPTP